MRRTSFLRKAFKALGTLIGALLALIIFNALQHSSQQLSVDKADIEIDKEGVLPQLLSKAISFKTISARPPEQYDAHDFDQLHTFLKEVFPRVFATLQVETINQHSLLLTWKGTKEDEKPILFIAHQDVVKIENPELWKHPPFEGKIHDGFVWGRGAMDDKSAMIAQLYTIEELLKTSWQPQRTLYFAYGHDEEVGGKGAIATAKLLQERNIRFAAIYDEVMPITDGVLAGIDNPVALVGIAEKGYMNLKLSVESEGGHASTPPPNTAVGILARAISRLEDNPMPINMEGPVGKMFNTLAPEMGLVKQAVLSNQWLFGGLLQKQLASKASTNALIRTTIAATMFQGSQQVNVLPNYAEVKINFRMIPSNSSEDVIAYVKQIIDDEKIKVEIFDDYAEPTAVSSTDSNTYQALNRSIRESFPEALVAPTLMIGASDSRFYQALTDNTYRFRPIVMTAKDIKRVHGTDERISVANLRQMAVFYRQLFKNLAVQ